MLPTTVFFALCGSAAAFQAHRASVLLNPVARPAAPHFSSSLRRCDTVRRHTARPLYAIGREHALAGEPLAVPAKISAPRRWTAAAAATVALAAAIAKPSIARAARAAAAASGEHLHIGQKIANFFRQSGLPDELVLMLISAMPVVELRGGIPVGLWMGLPLPKVFGLCVLGNMVPIPVILLALRSPLVRRLARPVLERAKAKAAEFGDSDSQALALGLFVGIPLPGTGAWTGAMGAFLLGMPFQTAMAAIFGGVVAAGAIVSTLTLAGKAGAIAATGALAVFCLSAIARLDKTKSK